MVGVRSWFLIYQNRWRWNTHKEKKGGWMEVGAMDGGWREDGWMIDG